MAAHSFPFVLRLVQQPLSVTPKPPNTNYAALSSRLRTLHTMQDFSFSTFCPFCIFVLGEKHYLVFFFAFRPFALVRYCYCCCNDCCVTNPRKCRRLLRRLSAVHLLLLLVLHSLVLLCFILYPLQFFPPCNFLQPVYK